MRYSYYNLATDLYEYGWGASFHFCRFAYGEPFRQAIARHEHYLAHRMNLREGMDVLDVGCGVGGPAREIAKFSGVNIVGLNNNDYQIERATRYAAKEGMPDQLSFTKGDFMVGAVLCLGDTLLMARSKCRSLPTPLTLFTPSKLPSMPHALKGFTLKFSVSLSLVGFSVFTNGS